MKRLFLTLAVLLGLVACQATQVREDARGNLLAQAELVFDRIQEGLGSIIPEARTDAQRSADDLFWSQLV